MKKRVLLPLAVASLAAAAPAAAADRLAAVTLDGGRATVYTGSPDGLQSSRVFAGADRAVLSLDARFVAYTRRVGGSVEIRVASLSGGPDRRVAQVRPFDIALTFTRNGRRLAYSSAGGIATVGLSGGDRRAVRLPAAWRGSRFSSIAFTPDGRRLVVSRTSGDGRAGTLRNELALVQLATGASTTLHTSANAYDQQARPTSFTPDGSYVAVDGTGAVLLARIAPGEGDAVVPRRPRATDYTPLISPDGRHVAFARAPYAGVSDVYVAAITGAELRRVTTTPIPPRGTPKVGTTPLAWSPDATKLLVFRHDRFALVDVATAEVTELRRTGVRYAISSARWFGAPPVPGSTGTIVFERGGDLPAGLWAVRADGTGLKRLTPDALPANPAWSPDGTKIAYTGGHVIHRQLFTMDADGSNRQQLTHFEPGVWVGNPSWFRGGPIGVGILFTLYAYGQAGADLYTIGSDGGTATPLTQTPEKESYGSFSPDGRLAFEIWGRFWIRGEDFVARPGGLGSGPTWSPDGRQLLVVVGNGLHGGSIGVVDPDGRNFRYVAWGSSPAWSPDGSSIVYNDGGGLAVMRADGLGRPRRLTLTPRHQYDSSPSWTAAER